MDEKKNLKLCPYEREKFNVDHFGPELLTPLTVFASIQQHRSKSVIFFFFFFTCDFSQLDS